MIATVEESALLRDGKTQIKVGDIVRVELNKNIWQIVAISGEYTVERNFHTDKYETVKPYRKVMARKLFNAKGVFKPSLYAEVIHIGWVYKPRKDKLEEFNEYFAAHPADREVKEDLSVVLPDTCGYMAGLANFNGADVAVVVKQLRDELGSKFIGDDFKRVISEWTKKGKISLYHGIEITQEIKNRFPYRIFACGYDGCYDKNTEQLYLTCGVDKSAEETNYWFNDKNARRAIREAGKEISGTFYAFREN